MLKDWWERDQDLRDMVKTLLGLGLFVLWLFGFLYTGVVFGAEATILGWSFLFINGFFPIAIRHFFKMKTLFATEGKTAKAELKWESHVGKGGTYYTPYVHLLNTSYPEESLFYLENCSLDTAETPNGTILDVIYVDGKREPKSVVQKKDLPDAFESGGLIMVWAFAMTLWLILCHGWTVNPT